MARVETIEMAFKADISNLQSELGKMPGITDKEARKMVSQLNTQMKKAERAAKRAAKATRKSWKKTADQIGKAAIGVAGLGVAFVAMGQKTADATNLLVDLGTRSGLAVDTLAGLQLAARGSGLEFSSLESALVGLPKRMSDMQRGAGEGKVAFERLGVSVENADGTMRSSDETFQDLMQSLSDIESPTEKAALATQLFGKSGTMLLQSLGNTAALDTFISQASVFGAEVGPDAAKSAGDWQRSMAGLTTVIEGAASRITASMGGGGISGVVDDLAAGIVFMTATATPMLEKFMSVISNVAGAVAAFTTDGISGFSRWNEQNDIFNDGLFDFTGILDGAVEQMEKYQKGQKAIIKSGSTPGPQGVFTPDNDGAVEVEKSIAKAADGLDTLAAKWRRAIEVSQVGELQVKTDEDRLEIQELHLAGKLTELELSQATAAADADLMAAEQARFDQAKKARDEAKAENDKNHQEQIAQMHERNQSNITSISGSVGAIGEAMAFVAEQGTEANSKAQRRLFNLSKAAAISDVAINSAVAITKALSQLGPVAGALAAGAITATAGVQAAVISSQELPAFHSGGVVKPDESMARLLKGEAVLTRQAVSQIGESGVRSLNSGGGGGSQVVAIPVYKHFDRFAQDEVRRSGALGKAIRGSARRGQRGY